MSEIRRKPVDSPKNIIKKLSDKLGYEISRRPKNYYKSTINPSDKSDLKKNDNINIIQIETISTCNATCSYCPRGVFPKLMNKRFLTYEILNRALELAKQGNAKVMVLHHAGEPFLHPELAGMVKVVREAGFFAHLSSNLISFNPVKIADVLKAGLNEFVIHLSAGLTKIDLEEMLKRIHEVRRLNWELRNNGCKIVVTFVMNEDSPAANYSEFLKSNYFDDSLPINYIQAHDWPELISLKNKGIDPKKCNWYKTRSASILANGDLVICCLDQFGASKKVNIMDIDKLSWEYLSNRNLCKGCTQYKSMDNWIENECLSVPDWLSARQKYDSWKM